MPRKCVPEINHCDPTPSHVGPFSHLSVAPAHPYALLHFFQACLHLFVTISICANLMCTASTTFVSVWGSGKALRGKDGSMDAAVDGMHAERAFIFTCFGVGLITTLLALMSAAWILMTFEVAVVATLGISWCIFIIGRQAKRINAKFGLSEEDVISFADIMQSPAVPNHDGDDAETAGLIRTVKRGAYEL